MGPFIDGYEIFHQRVYEKKRSNRAGNKKRCIAASKSRHFIRSSLTNELYDSPYDSPLHSIADILYDPELTWRKKGRLLLNDYATHDMDNWPETAKTLLQKAFLKAGGEGQYNISGEQAHRLIRKLVAVLLQA